MALKFDTKNPESVRMATIAPKVGNRTMNRLSNITNVWNQDYIKDINDCLWGIYYEINIQYTYFLWS
jgi:hypothetical protein